MPVFDWTRSELDHELAECGASVAILDLREDSAARVAEEITQNGGIAKGYGANVLDKQSLESAYEKIKEDFGKCDILINGAGGGITLKVQPQKIIFFWKI